MQIKKLKNIKEIQYNQEKIEIIIEEKQKWKDRESRRAVFNRLPFCVEKFNVFHMYFYSVSFSKQDTG